jgi:hypothetical protein
MNLTREVSVRFGVNLVSGLMLHLEQELEVRVEVELHQNYNPNPKQNMS